MSTASEDTLAGMKPLELAELGEDSAELVLRHAAEMDSNIPYRQRVVSAVQWYGAPYHYPYLTMRVNKLIREATDKKHREAGGE